MSDYLEYTNICMTLKIAWLTKLHTHYLYSTTNNVVMRSIIIITTMDSTNSSVTPTSTGFPPFFTS
uniref:Uncharacterized protein n=1 Tax=Heterorhabditis bacteriophora TaxID=37862 RepID=A0A1I7X4Z4_HETBA